MIGKSLFQARGLIRFGRLQRTHLAGRHISVQEKELQMLNPMQLLREQPTSLGFHQH